MILPTFFSAEDALYNDVKYNIISSQGTAYPPFSCFGTPMCNLLWVFLLLCIKKLTSAQVTLAKTMGLVRMN